MAEKGGGQDLTNAQPKKKGFKLPFTHIGRGSKPKETHQAEPDAHELRSRLGASPGHTPAGRRTSVPPSDESGESSMQPQRSQTFSGDSPRIARPASREAKKLEKQRKDEEKRQEELRKRQEDSRKRQEEMRKRQEESKKRQEEVRKKQEERQEEMRKKHEERQEEASRKRQEELRKKKQQKDAAKHSKTATAPKTGGHGPTSPTSKDRSLEAAPLSGSSVPPPLSTLSSPSEATDAASVSPLANQLSPSDREQLEAQIEQLQAEAVRTSEEREHIIRQKELECKSKIKELEEKHRLSMSTHKASREDAVRNEIQPLQQQVEELQRRLAERDSEVVTLTKQVEVLQESAAEKVILEAQVRKLAVEKEACATIVKRQQHEALVKQEELQKSREAVDQERNSKQKVEANYQQALGERRQLQEQLRSLQVQTQEQVQVLRAKEEELQAQARREKQERDATLNELQRKDEALEGLQKMLEQEQQQRATAEENAKQVETARQAKDATTSEAATQLQVQLRNVQKQLADKTQEVHELLQEHEAKLKEKEEEYQVTLEQIREGNVAQLQEKKDQAIQAAQLRQEESRQYWDQQQAQLTQQIKDLEQTVVEKDVVISQLRSDLSRLPSSEPAEEEDWEEEGGEDGEYVSAPSSMQDVKEPQISLTGLQQRLEDAEQEFDAQQQDLQAQATELQATRDQLEQGEQEAIEMREQLDDMTTKLEERDRRIKNLEDTVRNKVSAKSEEEADQYVDQLTKLTEQVTDLEAKSEKKDKENKALKEIVERAEKVEDQLQQKTSELSELELEHKKLNEENRKLKLRGPPADRTDVTEELLIQAVNTQQHQEQVEQLKSELRSTRTHLESKENEIQRLHQQLVEQEQLQRSLPDRTQPKKNGQAQLHKEDDSLQSGGHSPTHRALSLSGSEDSLSLSSLTIARARMGKLKQELKDKEQVIRNLQVQAASFQQLAQREEKVYGHSKQQSQEVSRLKKELEDMKGAKVSEAQERQRKLREQEEEMELLREEYQRLLKVEEEALKQPGAESSVDNIEKVMSALSESEHSRQDLTQRLQGAQTRIEALEQANRELQDGKRRLSAQSTHVAHLSSQLEATRRESDQLKKEKEELQNDLDAMRHQAEEYREGFEHERRDREGAAGHMVEHQGTINYQFQQYRQQKDAEIHQYQAQLEKERAAYGKLVDKFDELQLQFVNYKEDAEKQKKKEKRVSKGSERSDVEKLVADTARLSDEVLMKTHQVRQYEKKVETYKAQRDQALQEVESYKAQLGMIQQQGGVNVDPEEIDIKIATAESEKEDAKKQLHDMKQERDQLVGELVALKVKLAETAQARGRDGQETNQDARRVARLAEHITKLTQENERFKAALIGAGLQLPSAPQKLASPDQPIPRAKFQASQHAMDVASQQRQRAPPRQDHPRLYSGFLADRQAHPQQNSPRQFADPVYSQAAAERRAPYQEPYYQPPHSGAPLSLSSTMSHAHGGYQGPHPHPQAGPHSRYDHDGPMSLDSYRSTTQPMQPQHPVMHPGNVRERVEARQARRPQSLVDNIPSTPPTHVGAPPPHYATPKPGDHVQSPVRVAEDPQHYDAASGDKPRSETLVRGLSLEISRTVQGYDNQSMGDSFEETTPLDPNLVCPYCNRRFRIGEIQKFRSHVFVCTGT